MMTIFMLFPISLITGLFISTMVIYGNEYLDYIKKEWKEFKDEVKSEYKNTFKSN